MMLITSPNRLPTSRMIPKRSQDPKTIPNRSQTRTHHPRRDVEGTTIMKELSTSDEINNTISRKANQIKAGKRREGKPCCHQLIDNFRSHGEGHQRKFPERKSRWIVPSPSLLDNISLARGRTPTEVYRTEIWTNGWREDDERRRERVHGRGRGRAEGREQTTV